jgi:putative DNA primase/helicase
VSATVGFLRAVEQATGRPGRQVGRNTRLLCPAHDDHDPSLDVAEGNDGRPLVICRSHGCSYEEICAAIGWETGGSGGDAWTPSDPVVAIYPYEDEQGKLLFEVCRTASKGFPLRRPDTTSASGYRWGLDGTRRVLYRLPGLLEAARTHRGVFVVEGEKDVDALAQLGLVATCNPGGAGKWRPEYAEFLRGTHVVVVPDADHAGREHAQAVAKSLLGIADSVRILDLAPNVEDKSDASDFLAGARSEQERNQARALLVQLARDTPEFVSAHLEVDRAERNGDSSRLPFARLGEALRDMPAEPPWLWEGYLAPGTLTLLAGRPKVGKSTLVFGLLAALGAGEPFLDHQTRAAGALLLTEERSLTLRSKADRFPLGGDIHVLMRHQARGETWARVIVEAVAYCEEHNLGLLMVDTWNAWTSLPGDAENEAGAVQGALEAVTMAAGRGLAVLLIAHQRKSLGTYGEAVRGSNALIGGVDIVAELERPAADTLAGEGSRVLRAVSRFDTTREELFLALTDTGYEAQGDGLTVRAEGERRRLLEALEAQPAGATADDLSSETGIPAGTVRKRLTAMVEAGDIKQEGAGKRGDPYSYSLSFLSARPESQGAETNRHLVEVDPNATTRRGREP